MVKKQLTKSERDGLLVAGTAIVVGTLVMWIGIMLKKDFQAAHQEPKHTNVASIRYGETYQDKKKREDTSLSKEYTYLKKQLLKKYEQKTR